MILLEMNDDLLLVLVYAMEAIFACTESAVTNRHAAEPG
jgi:hypothetical protein